MANRPIRLRGDMLAKAPSNNAAADSAKAEGQAGFVNFTQADINDELDTPDGY